MLKRRENLGPNRAFKFSRLFKKVRCGYASRTMTFDEACQPFMLYGQVEKGYAPETLEKFRECFRSWIRPRLGNLRIEAVTYLHLLEFRKLMSEANLSVARQYSILMVLKLLFRFCRNQLRIACLDPAEIRLPRRIFKKVEFLTDHEVAQLLRIVPTHTFVGVRLRALIEVLLSTGLRISEALSLNRDSIDRETGEAEVIGKGRKLRTAFFSPQCLIWIHKYVEMRFDNCPALFATTGKLPRRLSRNDMSKLFRRLRQKSGITKHLTPHLLRHTFCTSLLHKGADIMFIKELAGHRDIQTTARYYLGVDKASLKAVLQRCQIHGWSEQPAVMLQPQVVPESRKQDSVGGPAWLLGDPARGNSGTLFPGAHAPGSL